MLVDIANRQAELGHRVTIIVVNDEENDELMSKLAPEVEVVRMHRRQGDKPLLMMLRLNILIARLRPDIVHAHHHKFCRLVMVRRNRLLLTVHCKGTPMLYASGSRMVAISDAVRDDVLSRVPDADIRTIFNGIHTSEIAERGHLNPGDRLRIVQVANLLPDKKGQDILIKALGILNERRGVDAEVTFIGKGDTDFLAGIAAELGVADRVHFLGGRSRSYIYSHLCEYDAMCHPSRSEGFGLTTAEGMAAGLPLILTEGDGPWEIADKGRLCLSTANGDAASVADAIEQLASNYDAALARAAEARKYVGRYDISHTVDNYIDYYRRIVEK